MDRFQAVTAFVKVVEAGSFVRAANRLGVSVSAVSRHVADLETHLDVRLLNRTTRRLSLTESGRLFYERCVQLLADLEEAEESASASTVAPRGTLRLSAPVTFGERHLAPAIGAFVGRYPGMRFDVELSDRAVDLVDEGFDAAIRIGAIGSQNLVGRKIGETRMVCCAAPAYLDRRGEPKHPDDLAAHDCLTYEYAGQRNTWLFRDRDGSARSVRVSGAVHANSGRFLAALAVEGLGIACEPNFIVGPELRAGHVVPILHAFQPAPSSIQIVYPSRKHLSAKVRTFADFLRERFAASDWTAPSSQASGTRRAAADARRNGRAVRET
ncbi:MAG: LysR substrate-binding domain-containing protein [Casimicrobiaceae bacterium]